MRSMHRLLDQRIVPKRDRERETKTERDRERETKTERETERERENHDGR